MPNRYQFAFLFSLFGTFGALVTLSTYIKGKLAAAGYDVSNLILLGLPKKDSANEYHGMDFHAVDIPYFGTQDLVALAASPAFIASAGLVLAGLLWTTVINSGPRKVLNPKNWLEFPLEKKIQISPNTAIYRFSLPRPNDYLGLPVGKHIAISAEINGKDITRSYTPISSDDQKGSFDLLIKSYEKGNVSRHFSLLSLGNNIRVKGPKGNFEYTPGLTGALGMIAGGSGITPMYQIINAVLKNPADRTALSLIYANVNEEDILMKKELDALASKHGDRFKVYYVLNNPPAGWTGGVGFVSKDQIQTRLPASTHDAKILMCGPPPMLAAMKKHLDELQWPAPRTISKLADKVFLF
ncbi:ferredoxin reductase-like C-terminal NADP-linked domain-containing protein [Mycena albidolilacea]|uniref:NADH-cytochrome b5 reductase n=1 Tax=Mycena albidolilacea TaxID=1033008 RepID=A0AAD7EXV8_9AGAR|nr:ferredoxin reductase-like C-terminal NADP-linked domain-containing protein [Mycena albidolilacea]